MRLIKFYYCLINFIQQGGCVQKNVILLLIELCFVFACWFCGSLKTFLFIFFTLVGGFQSSTPHNYFIFIYFIYNYIYIDISITFNLFYLLMYFIGHFVDNFNSCSSSSSVLSLLLLNTLLKLKDISYS